MISDTKRELIAIEVIKILNKSTEYIQDNFSTTDKNPFYMSFYKGITSNLSDNCFVKNNEGDFIGFSSWLHGLNTTLGQSFFENVAHILSEGYKREFTSKSNTLLNVTLTQKQAIKNIIIDLKNSTESPNLNRENSLIFIDENQADLDANSFTADVFIESHKEIVAIELKSVRPNSGEMGGEKQKILQAKAALYKAFPEKQIKYYIGFPFDPTSDTPTGYDKVRLLDYLVDGNKYFASDEVLLANELWDNLSGSGNSMEQIFEIINAIATPEFLEKYNYLNDNQNRLKDATNYKTLLQKWHLFKEIELQDNIEDILDKTKDNPKAYKIFRQPVFENGKYNQSRFEYLKTL